MPARADARPGRRRRDQRKLDAIADAARALMTERGVRLTAVGDVARRAGVAVGTIYLYAREKDDLVELALRSAADWPLAPTGGSGLGPGLDPDAREPVGVAALAAQVLPACFRWPVLAGSTKAEPRFDVITAVFAETYDLVARRRALIAWLDRCAPEVPALAVAWHEGIRGPYFAAVADCLRRHRAAGVVRCDLEPALMARALIEMIVWAAARSGGDPVPVEGDGTERRTTTLALVTAALRPPR